MKFDNLELNNTRKEGDIKSNAVGIDLANINFITTILSTNLYSNPIESFIRETVSNAWDSHVEAGINDLVSIEIGKDTEDRYYCTIRDNGVGLSEERFNNIYKNIGSSTKRDGNDQIGGFGIGRFSALAYSETVYINSIYNGVLYKYLMYKDGNNISIDLLYKSNTSDRNGVEVKVFIKNQLDITKFIRAIANQLSFFENLVFINNTDLDSLCTFEEKFNNLKIKKYNNFSVNDTYCNYNTGILLGKVTYPLNFNYLNEKYDEFYKKLPILVNLNIGDIDVTPNREEINYNSRTIDIIEKALDRSFKELDGIISKKTNKDFDDIMEYIGQSQSSVVDLISDDIYNKSECCIIVAAKNLNYTFKGETLSLLDLNVANRIFLSKPLFLNKYVLSSNYTPISRKKGDNYIRVRDFLDINNTFIIVDCSKIKPITKRYLKHYVINNIGNSRALLIVPESLIKIQRRFLNSVTESCSIKTINSKEFKILYRYYFNKIKNALNVKIDDNSVSKAFIEKEKAERKKQRENRVTKTVDFNEYVNLFYLENSSRYLGDGLEVVTRSNNIKISHLYKKNKNKKLTIYSIKNDAILRALYKLCNKHSNYNFVEIAQSRMDKLKNIPNFIHIKDFMNIENKLIRNIGTVVYIDRNLPYLKQLWNIKNIDSISKNINIDIVKIRDFYMKFKSNSTSDLICNLLNEIYELCVNNNWFNIEIQSILNKNKKIFDNMRYLLYLSEPMCPYNSRDLKIPDEKINFAVDYAIARKLFIPDYSAVLKLKAETIYSINEVKDIKTN